MNYYQNLVEFVMSLWMKNFFILLAIIQMAVEIRNHRMINYIECHCDIIFEKTWNGRMNGRTNMANYLKIAVAIDFSEQSLKALDRANQLAKEHNAILQLVNVIDTKSFGAVSAYDLKYAEELKKENILKMEKLEKEALQTGVKAVESIVETGSPKVF